MLTWRNDLVAQGASAHDTRGSVPCNAGFVSKDSGRKQAAIPMGMERVPDRVIAGSAKSIESGH